jgi:hypothetical protein
MKPITVDGRWIVAVLQERTAGGVTNCDVVRGVA